MESKINYTLVGLFVVLLSAGLIIFAYWLGKYGGQQEYDDYYVYMSESVAGLSNDASVKYRGVEVGTVAHIGLNPNNSEQVELLLKIKHKTPIKTDTTATLKLYGLTGLAYLELAGGKRDSPLLTHTTDEIPVIPSKPSIFALIDESMSDIAGKSALALDKFVRLLSDKNLQYIEATLLQTNLLVKDLNGQLQGFHNLVNNGIVMEKRVTRAFEKVEVASTRVTNMADSLEKNYANVGHNMRLDVQQSLESFNRLLYQLNNLTEDMQRTVQSIEASPSDLIFKRSQPKPGPGEDGYNEK